MMRHAPRILSDELAKAIAEKRAPSFEVLTAGFKHDMTPVFTSIRFVLRVKIGGEVIPPINAERMSGRELPAINGDGGFKGTLGSVDLIQQAFLQAVQRRWEYLTDGFVQAKLCDYSVHAVGDEESHLAALTMTLRLPNGDEWAVRKEGVDTIGLIIEAMHEVYHWLAWRLLTPTTPLTISELLD